MAMTMIWIAMLVLSMVFALATGRTVEVGQAAAAGAKRAVELCVTIAGNLVLWSGFAELLRRGGVQEKLARLLSPLLGRLFPTARRDKEAMGALSGNVTANLLGLGSAATPLGIAAARRMKTLSGSDTASDELCRLIVLNTASVQLLPTGIASIRAGLGARSGFDILPAVWLTSILSVSAGLLAAWLLAKRWR